MNEIRNTVENGDFEQLEGLLKVAREIKDGV
jgi:hypothetical protein